MSVNPAPSNSRTACTIPSRSGPQGIEMFSQLKSFTYGAAPMPPPLLRAAMKTWPDMDLMQVYGLTEVCGVATHLLPEEHRQAEAEGHPERLLSAGRAIPGMEVRIVDTVTLQDAPTGAPGEIWLDEKTGLPVRQTQTGPAKAGGQKDSACDDDWPSTTKTSSYTLSRFGKAPKVVAPKHAVTPKQAVGSGGGDGGSTPV